MLSLLPQNIRTFLNAPSFAVVGASTDRAKYGNKVLRCYLQHQLEVIPVNPGAAMIEGLACVSSVAELPAGVASISIITPPAVTEQVVKRAAEKGIANIWMQPGAESRVAVDYCLERGMNVIADGSCLLVVLGYRDN